MPKFRQTDSLEHMLKRWYGRDAGEREVLSWLPKPRPIGDAVREIADRLALVRTDDLMAAVEVWGRIAGMGLAKYSRPVSFQESAMIVEYDRAAVLRELLLAKKKMIQKLQESFGESFCTDLWFRPTGG